MMGICFGKPDLQDLPAKRNPVGRAVPFLRMERLAYPTLPRLPNPHSSLRRTVRGLAAPCTPAGTRARPGTGPSQQLPKTKRPPKMDSLANPNFTERQLSQPKQPEL